MARRGGNLYFQGVAAFGHPNPTPTFDAQGRLASVAYGDGAVKTLTYGVDGKLVRVDLVSHGVTLCKTLSYDAQGRWAGTLETVV